MNGKKLFAFVFIVLIILATVIGTSPYFMKNIKLGLDLKGGFETLYVASAIDEGGVVTKESLKETAKSLLRRVDAQGIAEPEINPEGNDRIRVKIAGVTDQTKVREVLSKPSVLNFRGPDGKVVMDGGDFVPNGAKVEYEDGTRPIVAIKLKSAANFKRVTTELLGKQMGIYLDDVLKSNPNVGTVIDSDTATITGTFTIQEAKDLANTINLGALPLKLTEKYTQSVGATLGQKSLDDTIKASIIALVLIMIGVIAYYRVPGAIASFTLLTYTWMLLVVFDLLNATMTLPGIAAFVLGIGMAVDANIITYERIREELRSGKSIYSSLRAGSKTSFRTIIDSHVTILLAAAVLYFIGSGAIQGFALTLIFSVLVSLISNVFLSRVLLQLLVKSGVVNKPHYFGVKEAEINAL
ncbi:protein translocase subunit SecD [Paenibacillus psychroresistens]|uniref:Protein translocase subunit SecD n=1 Tax=Paenibacillus psychroresistens TaxID=1778678 RepID=A0A6B8RI57_9BACL|nr:protein translocase subunit SecD [Paenibacillus psychroresistens]QGQ95424.1 protein translocase subunit SecD [Paenibacillus psychroresistens]